MNKVLDEMNMFLDLTKNHEVPTVLLIRKARDEIVRLLEGNFSEEEFQNLCHTFGEDDKERFKQGCLDYQKKLFECKGEA